MKYYFLFTDYWPVIMDSDGAGFTFPPASDFNKYVLLEMFSLNSSMSISSCFVVRVELSQLGHTF